MLNRNYQQLAFKYVVKLLYPGMVDDTVDIQPNSKCPDII